MKKKLVMVAMVTPFDQDCKIDDEAVIRLCNHLIEQRVDGIVVAGTTGEAASLTYEERGHLLKLVKETVGRKAEVWMGCGTNNTKETLNYCFQAESLGADGIMLITPYYVRPSQRGLFEYFSYICSKIHLPVMLYNVPKRTGVNMESKTVIELARKHSNITMYKQAHKDRDGILEILAESNLKVLCGDDFWYDEALVWGMDGIVSVAGQYDCELIHRMNAFNDMSLNSSALAERFKSLARLCFLVSSPSDIKAMLAQRNLCHDEVRLPLVKLNEEEKQRLVHVLKDWS